MDVHRTPPLSAADVVKRYGRKSLALRKLDLEVRRGSVTALVGPNGAGKSTLMKAWVGFERPTSGRVLIDGIDPWQRGGRREAIPRIGYVPQDVALYRDLTVAQHLTLVAGLRRAFDRSAAEARLGDVGIDIDAVAGELSGGQRAQVSLALALASGGHILILDEPLASLDPLARREFLQLVREHAQREARTTVLSSHVVTDVQEVCDHLVVLASGNKVLDAPISETLASHAIADSESAVVAGIEVSGFPGPTGQTLRLIRTGAERPANVRAATLEEVVLGYLAVGRRNKSDGTPPPGPQ